MELVDGYKESYATTVKIVDTKNSMLSYLKGVKQSGENAVKSGLKDEQSMDELVS